MIDSFTRLINLTSVQIAALPLPPAGTILFDLTTGQPVASNGAAVKTIPYADGTGASGTWGISITGNAGTLDGIDSTGFALASHVHSAADISAADITSGTLAVARGGTGLASYAVGDLIYASGATTLIALAGVAVGRVLVSGGVGAAPAWSLSPTMVGNWTFAPASGIPITITPPTAVLQRFNRAGSNVFEFQQGGAGSLFALYDATAAETLWQVQGGNVFLEPNPTGTGNVIVGSDTNTAVGNPKMYVAHSEYAKNSTEGTIDWIIFATNEADAGSPLAISLGFRKSPTLANRHVFIQGVELGATTAPLVLQPNGGFVGINLGVAGIPAAPVDLYFDSGTYSATALNPPSFYLSASATAGDYSGIGFHTMAGTRECFFGVTQVSGHGEFVWQGFNGSAYLEYMRLTSAGNHVIGATTIANAAGWSRISQITAADFSAISLRKTGAPARQWDIGNNNGPFAIYDATAGAYRLTIDTAGPVDILRTAEQLSISYDASNRLSTTVSSTGTTTLALAGTNAGFVFTPTGTGNLKLSTGMVSLITTGSAAVAGNATLVGGTKAVATDAVTANTLVVLTRKTTGGTIGTAITYTLQTGAPKGFTVGSDNPLDTSTFSWFLVEGH